MSASNRRPNWPKEEFDIWRKLKQPLDDTDSSEVVAEDEFDAIRLFEMRTVELLETHITEFINDRCSQKGVGSPDLRRIARVTLSHAVAQCADNLIVQNSAICREHGLPWTVLAEVTESKGIIGFKRKWGDAVEQTIARRAKERSLGPIYGDSDYWPRDEEV